MKTLEVGMDDNTLAYIDMPELKDYIPTLVCVGFVAAVLGGTWIGTTIYDKVHQRKLNKKKEKDDLENWLKENGEVIDVEEV